MKRSHLFVAVEVDGALQVHLPGAVSDYATLCGLDGNDPGGRHGIGGDKQTTVEAPSGAKVDCEICKSIWETAKQFRSTDFKKGTS